jgi:hypothetical protein
MKQGIHTSNKERFMKPDELIVSKTTPKGMVTYGNSVFCEIADYTLKDVINKPHNLVRNPNMPRSVFKLMWEKLGRKEEVFAYVVNCGKKGDHYWVFAHVTPSLSENGDLLGYHSNRRKPSDSSLAIIKSLYKTLLEEENKQSSEHAATQAGYDLLQKTLCEKGMDYDEFVLSL